MAQQNKNEVKVLFQQGDATGVKAIAQSPDNKILATGGVDAFIHLRNLKTGIEYKLLIKS